MLAQPIPIEWTIQPSASGRNAIWNDLKRQATFSLSVLPGGNIAFNKGYASIHIASGKSASSAAELIICLVHQLSQILCPFHLSSRIG